MRTRGYLAFILIFFLTACSNSSNAPVSAVERYYLALVQQDQNDLSNVVCPDFEETARIELDSYQGVKIELTDFACSESETNEQETLVKCTGKIVATYGNEKMEFPLEGRVHKVIHQSDAWLVCGY